MMSFVMYLNAVIRSFHYRFAIYLLAVTTLFATRLQAADLLVWQAKQNRVTANVDGTDLEKLLGRIAGVTGWQIYLEPGTSQAVSVKFKDLPPGEALKRFLGDLNFALLPQNGSASKLFIYRTSLQEATQVIQPKSEAQAESKKTVPNELVVTLNPNSKESIEALARRLGAKIVDRMDQQHSYRLQFQDEASTQAARDLLAADPNIGSVDSNYIVDQPTQTERLQMSSPPPFKLTPKVSDDASKVIIGLIDTPVQKLSAGMNEFLMPSIQVAGAAGNLEGQLSHGTSMAETILNSLSASTQESGGSSVRILPVDVYGPNGETTTFDVAKGIYAAINAGATIINLSLGGAGDSKMLSDMIRDTHQQGVVFFGAAGNQPSTAPTYPAAYPEVVAVTAGDRRGNIASYANRGSFVDVMAPGVSVVEHLGESFLISGTSASTAYVSGAAAAYRASGKTAAQAEAYVRETLAIKPPPAPAR